MAGFGFHEVMEGTLDHDGASVPFSFALDVRGPSRRRFFDSWLGVAVGTTTIGGLVQEAPARGTLEIAPVRQGMIRYVFDFQTPEGRALRFDGRKRIRLWFIGWTLLRGAVLDADGNEIGAATLRFLMRRHLVPFVKSFRTIRRSDALPR
jgi:hypothetical protein